MAPDGAVAARVPHLSPSTPTVLKLVTTPAIVSAGVHQSCGTTNVQSKSTSSSMVAPKSIDTPSSQAVSSTVKQTFACPENVNPGPILLPADDTKRKLIESMSDTKTTLAPSQKPVISSTNFATSTSLTKSKPDINISTIISSSSSVSSISKTIDSNSISTNHDVKECRTETEETEEKIIVEGSVKRLAQIYSSGEQHGNHPENIPVKRSDVSKLTMPKQPCEKLSASDISHLQNSEFQYKDENIEHCPKW